MSEFSSAQRTTHITCTGYCSSLLHSRIDAVALTRCCSANTVGVGILYPPDELLLAPSWQQHMPVYTPQHRCQAVAAPLLALCGTEHTADHMPQHESGTSMKKSTATGPMLHISHIMTSTPAIIKLLPSCLPVPGASSSWHHPSSSAWHTRCASSSCAASNTQPRHCISARPQDRGSMCTQHITSSSCPCHHRVRHRCARAASLPGTLGSPVGTGGMCHAMRADIRIDIWSCSYAHVLNCDGHHTMQRPQAEAGSASWHGQVASRTPSYCE
jgi:hypothetical protein